jgi:uncharacterized ferritin-like protein (DUF455 family)
VHETVEDWAFEYVATASLAHKLAPPPPPDRWMEHPTSTRLSAPGRPAELDVRSRAKPIRSLATSEARAKALATFLHHELQAAELMAWALLAFADAPREFREGLLRIALDEVRHMRMYQAHIEQLGFGVGDFPVRDWFWERVPTARDARAFVAVMGLGLESANLEHARTFAERFRAAGDEAGAALQERVGAEEIAHVRFGVKWFGELTFDAWKRSLPEPLSPMLMRGTPIHREARMRAGQPEPFIDELTAWTPE